MHKNRKYGQACCKEVVKIWSLWIQSCKNLLLHKTMCKIMSLDNRVYRWCSRLIAAAIQFFALRYHTLMAKKFSLSWHLRNWKWIKIFFFLLHDSHRDSAERGCSICSYHIVLQYSFTSFLLENHIKLKSMAV